MRGMGVKKHSLDFPAGGVLRMYLPISHVKQHSSVKLAVLKVAV